jgi:3',5'-cyclic AMP phosphodiesterase CpdA
VAERVVHLFDLDGAIGLAHLADELDVDAVVLTGAFADLGAQLGIDWAQQTAARMNPPIRGNGCWWRASPAISSRCAWNSCAAWVAAIPMPARISGSRPRPIRCASCAA